MASCIRCGKEFNGISSLLSFNRETKRCKGCDADVQQALTRFRYAFLNFTNTILTSEEWQVLLNGAHNDRLDINEALAFVRADALNHLNRLLDLEPPRDELERYRDVLGEYIYRFMQWLAIQGTDAAFILRRVNILNIRTGRLPHILVPDIQLDSDEICHMVIGASYHKVNTSSTALIHGRFVATSKKLRFLSASGGVEIPWNSIMSVRKTWIGQMSSPGVYLELSKKSGNGLYSVPDADMVVAIIDTLVRVFKRQLIKMDNDSSRHIPQEVKIAVWQRDQARCVQCRATDYLEYDHIIPFSKGGASTVNNVQLLCRRCNQAKGGRI